MDRVVQKSLKLTIIQQISELNRNNVEFYALLRKLEEFNQPSNQTVNQRLETIRLDIRDKIKNLAYNIDLLYQTFDQKISIILNYINQFTGKNTTKLEQQLQTYSNQIAQLTDQNKFIQSRYQAVVTQHEQLKQKNMLLMEQVDILSKKAIATNDSNQSDNRSRQYLKRQSQDTVSLEHRLISNDLTFNQKPQKRYKTIRSQENSFSSVLIRQQNSFEPNIKPSDSSYKLAFGCLPRKKEELSKPNDHVQFNGNQRVVKAGREGQQKHRMEFLINNLREAHETTLTSQRSFVRTQNHHQNSQQKSVLSKGVVKKYMI